jgi:hypothetical protein
MINPTVVPPEQRLYFRPEENLDNRYFEKAKMESQEAYGCQRYNSDFYPQRNRSMKREVFAMDRRTLIASFDILSQSFRKDDPIATELRTMAYAVSKMGDDELSNRLSEVMDEEVTAEKTASEFKEGSAYTDFVKKYMKKNPDADIADAAKAWKKEKKASEEKKAAEEEVVEEKGAAKKKEEEKEMDKWSKEATDAVSRALVSDVFDIDISKKKAGKEKGPGVPDGTGPYGGTEKCPMSEKKEEKEAKGDEKAEKMEEKAQKLLEKAEKMEKGAEEDKKAEKDPESEPGRQPQEEGDVEEEHKEEENDKDAACGKDHEDEKKEADKVVDTDILSSIDIPATEEFDGIEIGNPMASEDIGDISDNEKVMLDQLFRNADLERLNEDDKAKLDQLFK